MRTIIIATHNNDKIKEIRQILDPKRWNLQGMEELGFTEDLPETGVTFAENAKQKTDGLAKHYPDSWIFADDSGLCVHALNNEPGVYSARFHADAPYPAKIKELQRRLREVSPDPETWTAHFACAIALRRPDTGETMIFEGRMDGRIHTEIKGDNGFGYDPAFYLPDLEKTNAELGDDEKNARSHRGQALRKMADWMEAHRSELT